MTDHRCTPTLLRRAVHGLILTSTSALFAASAILVYQDWLTHRAVRIIHEAALQADLMVATYDMDEDQAALEAELGDPVCHCGCPRSSCDCACDNPHDNKP